MGFKFSVVPKSFHQITAIIVLVHMIFLSQSAFADPLKTSPETTTTSTQLPAINSQKNETSDIDSINLDYLKGYFIDTGKILSSPVHWDSKDWLKFGAVAGITAGLFMVDGKVRDFAHSHQSNVAGKFATIGNDLGNGLYTLPPVGAFYLYGYLNNDTKAR